MAPLRALAIVPEPSGSDWAPTAAAVWAALDLALREHVGSGRLELTRLVPATANALEERLARESFDVVHIIGRGSSRPAARHGTLTLEGSDRRPRELNAQNLAKQCALVPGIRLVVVQPLGAPTELDVLCEAIFQQAASVIRGPAAEPADAAREIARFSAGLYASLIAGQSVDAALAAASSGRSSHAAPGSGPLAPRLLTRERPVAAPGARGAPSAPPGANALAPAAAPAPAAPAPAVASEEVLRAQAASAQLESKRKAGAFDVFLCHNVSDKPAVIQIGRQLMSHGILPWLDEWELPPGTPWQRVLEEQISRIRAAAVFVGPSGIGPWQRHELDGFLRELNTRGCPVIPVVLPSAGAVPDLPLFLRGITWVDFRGAAPDPMARLIWGITGVRAARER